MVGWGAGVLIALLLPPQGIPPHRPIAPEELARTSAVVGVASVLRSETRRDADSGGIFTDYRVTFHEVWKGVPGADFVLTQYGGTIDGRSAAIPGWTYALRPGEKFVLFAAPFKGRHTVVGMRQGLFRIPPADPSRVVKDTETALPERHRTVTSFDELKRAVYVSTGRTPPGPSTAPAPAGAAEEGAGPLPAEPAPAPVSDPRAAAPPPDPGRSIGLWLAGALFLAMLAIGWVQWRRKTETAR